MIRGTTPTLTFTTPYEAKMVSSGFITFTMRGKVLFDIPISDDSVVVEDYAVSLTLSQEQTLAFKPQYRVLVQVRLGLGSGEYVASNIIQIPIENVLRDGEI